MSVESTLMLLLSDAEQRRGGRRSADELGLEVGRVENAIFRVLDDDGVGCEHGRSRGSGTAINVEDHSERKVPIHVIGAPLTPGASGDEGSGVVEANLGRSVDLVLSEVGRGATRRTAGGGQAAGGGGGKQPSTVLDTFGGCSNRKEGGGGDFNVAIDETCGSDGHHDGGEEGTENET